MKGEKVEKIRYSTECIPIGPKVRKDKILSICIVYTHTVGPKLVRKDITTLDTA